MIRRCLSWWAYVLDDSRANHEYGPLVPWFYGIVLPWSGDHMPNYFARAVNWLSRVRCRWQGHPCGVWFYSGSMEPDNHCKDCGEDLG